MVLICGQFIIILLPSDFAFRPGKTCRVPRCISRCSRAYCAADAAAHEVRDDAAVARLAAAGLPHGLEALVRIHAAVAELGAPTGRFAPQPFAEAIHDLEVRAVTHLLDGALLLFAELEFLDAINAAQHGEWQCHDDVRVARREHFRVGGEAEFDLAALVLDAHELVAAVELHFALDGAMHRRGQRVVAAAHAQGFIALAEDLEAVARVRIDEVHQIQRGLLLCIQAILGHIGHLQHLQSQRSAPTPTCLR